MVRRYFNIEREPRGLSKFYFSNKNKQAVLKNTKPDRLTKYIY